MMTSKTLFVSAGNRVFNILMRHNTLSDGDIKDFVCLLRKMCAKFLSDTAHSPMVTSKPFRCTTLPDNGSETLGHNSSSGTLGSNRVDIESEHETWHHFITAQHLDQNTQEVNTEVTTAPAERLGP